MRVRVAAPGRDVTHDLDQEFLAIIAADDEWVRREFDELVEAGWGGAPPENRPRAAGAHRRPAPRPTASRQDPLLRRAQLHPVTAPFRPRGPP